MPSPASPGGPPPTPPSWRPSAWPRAWASRSRTSTATSALPTSPGASGPERYLATIAHTDIVPTGEGWSFPPLEVTRKDGMLIGRGVADDKGPFVLSLYAAAYFARRAAAGHELPYTLRCIIGNNEETGMGDVPYYLERYPEPLFCFSPDAEFPLICGEKGLYGGEFTSGVVAGEKIVELEGGTVSNAIPGKATALVRADAAALPAAERVSVEDAGDGLARVTASGIGGHASMPAGTVNANRRARALSARQRPCGSRRARLPRAARDPHRGRLRARPPASPPTDDKFGDLTLVAGVVRTVDGRFTQTVDSRFPTSTTADQITARLTELAAAHDCSYEAGRGEKPFYVSPESPEIHALLDTYAEYTGRPARRSRSAAAPMRATSRAPAPLDRRTPPTSCPRGSAASTAPTRASPRRPCAARSRSTSSPSPASWTSTCNFGTCLILQLFWDRPWQPIAKACPLFAARINTSQNC